MSIIPAKVRKIYPKTGKEVHADTLIELARADERVVALEADLMRAVDTERFAEEFPDRLFDCGIAEADMVGIACGLSEAGLIPYTHTFGSFSTRRVYDQIYCSAGYARLTINLIGSDPGVAASGNGGTHIAFEDGALMRAFPGSLVVDACDPVQLRSAMRAVKDLKGVHYIRMPRKSEIAIYEDGSEFTLGKGVTLKEGGDVTLISSGLLLCETLDAAELLEKEGVRARVIDMFTWKPIDEELIVAAARETGAIVTAENHNVIGGLGSAVADVLAARQPAPLEKVGALDRFGQTGTIEFLKEACHMKAADIVSAAKRAMARK